MKNIKGVWVIAVVFALVGLGFTLPGFRPKHVRDIIVPFASDRGLSLLGAFGLFGLLMPAAYRLKRKFHLSSMLMGIASMLGVLITIENIWSVALDGSNRVALILLRLGYAIMVGWGLVAAGEFRKSGALWAKNRWGELRALSLQVKVLFVLVVFCFVRTTLYLYWTRRGVPFQPFGDEIPWWFAMAEKISHDGLAGLVRTVGYLPGLPWLNTLPARLLGVENREWLFTYPGVIMAGMALFVLEQASNVRVLLVATFMLFGTLLMNRDLFHLLAGSLYGESFCVLFNAVLIAWFCSIENARLASGRPWAWSVAIGAAFGFLSISKAPLSLFMYPYALWAAWRVTRVSVGRVRYLLAVWILALSWGASTIYKLGLKHYGVGLDNEFHLQAFLRAGVSIHGVFRILFGLLNYDAPQFYYTLGMLAAVLMLGLLRERAILRTVLIFVASQWAFVLGLYATLWQQGDYSSAGRYLLHSALAAILALALVQRERATSAHHGWA